MQLRRVASDRVLRLTASTQATPLPSDDQLGWRFPSRRWSPGLGRSHPSPSDRRRWSVNPASSRPIHPVDQCLDALKVQHLAGSIADYPTMVLGRNMEKVPGSDVDLLALIDLDLGSAGQDHTRMFGGPSPGRADAGAA